MAIYKLADLYIDIKNKYPYTDILCKDYLCNEPGVFPSLSVKADENDYASDKAYNPNVSDGYLEAVSIYRELTGLVLDFDTFMLHAAVVEKDGCGYAFSAKSGMGKTTHIRLWLEKYKDAKIINGDKPLVKITDDGVFAYGTPWCGKENYNTNAKTKLKAICFIERGKENKISPISKAEAVKRITSQIIYPKTPEKTLKLLELIDRFVESVPAYLLKCNMDISAAEVAYNGLCGKAD